MSEETDSLLPMRASASVRLLDAKQVAARLSVSVKMVRRMRDAGKLPPVVRIGRLIRWREKDIVTMIREM
jgi:predicted DNA-binding transcriptional regulator AlpA